MISCAFVLAYAKSRFSHYTADGWSCSKLLLVGNQHLVEEYEKLSHLKEFVKEGTFLNVRGAM